jgi:molybdopterin/thiamine biosynthesis adenylyltransferase/rhodanese-related sulfurtransferase
MIDRYARQTVLPEIGEAGQQRLLQSAVLVVGAGGLGCAVLQYLAAAGVGHLIVLDHDRVEESNLHRQPLYRMQDLGASKVAAARAALLALNPQLQIDAHATRLTAANAEAWVSRVAVVVDCADSFAVTYILSDACRHLQRPLVSASVLGFSGYAGVFCGAAPSYRAVFPDLPRQVGSCATSGVLGTAVGVLGTLQAHLSLAVMLGTQPAPHGRLTSVDLQRLRFSSFSFLGAPEPARCLPFVSVSQLDGGDLVMDLRTEDEIALAPLPAASAVAGGDVDALAQTEPSRRLVLCCRSGVRAWRAAHRLASLGRERVAMLALDA